MPTASTRGERRRVVRLELDFGSYELGTDECGELIRILRVRGDRPGGEAALACAQRLQALVAEDVDPRSSGGGTEEQLDAIAEAAWDWLQRSGPGDVPERVLVLLDVLRARHVHE